MLAGNRRWTEQVTNLLKQSSPQNDDTWIERAAAMLVTFSIGLAASYLDLPDKERARQRTTIIDDATRFATSGLGPSPPHARQPAQRKPPPKART